VIIASKATAVWFLLWQYFLLVPAAPGTVLAAAVFDGQRLWRSLSCARANEL
jgi:hypothetical protein